jgi:hypothetical protein
MSLRLCKLYRVEHKIVGIKSKRGIYAVVEKKVGYHFLSQGWEVCDAEVHRIVFPCLISFSPCL